MNELPDTPFRPLLEYLVTEQEKDDRLRGSFAYLCRRLLDIDPRCGAEKGCPFTFAAWPMIISWCSQNDGDRHPQIQDTLHRLVTVNGDGKVCEIGEVQLLARRWLNVYRVCLKCTSWGDHRFAVLNGPDGWLCEKHKDDPVDWHGWVERR